MVVVSLGDCFGIYPKSFHATKYIIISIVRSASRHCLDSREISAAPLRVSPCRRTRKAAFAAHELHEKYDTDIAPCKRPSPHTKTPALRTSRKGHGMWNLAASGFCGQMARAFNWPLLTGGLGICGEVDEQPELAANRAEVVHQPTTTFLCQCLHRLITATTCF